MAKIDSWIDQLLANLSGTDRELADEIRATRDVQSSPSRGLRGGTRSGRAVRAVRARRALRAVGETRRAIRQSVRNIVLRVGRPVLAVVDGRARLEFSDSASAVWKGRLERAGDRLRHAALATGRLEVTGLPSIDYVGTGWLVAPEVVVTNRHVALTFGARVRKGYGFLAARRQAPLRVSIDFLEEPGRRRQLEFAVVDILHIEDDGGPDFAFLRVEPRSGRHALAMPIPLATAAPRSGQQVAVIGYPAKDRRATDQKLMHQIFGEVYDRKRLSPGQITRVQRNLIEHDCSTLGGNSGSVVVDLDTGAAAGLHFAGRFLATNYAVPAGVVARRLEKVLRRWAAHPAHAQVAPAVAAGPVASGHIAAHEPEPDDFGVFVEGTVADYADRKGYDPVFTGSKVPLPVIRKKSDVLTFTIDGPRRSELKYQHFSVVMSRSRRLCIFSAGNIDGRTPARFQRPSWRLDPRIPKEQQIREECYGNPPLFSRGHMTRREDPIWGTPEEAALGNSDSMHVTNTVPQMQPFNAGVWLGLEDYALQHARSDKMRISVFTGPFFLADDPVREGVRIPRSFWKVMAFVHDRTHELCATGYTMSQASFIGPDEFIFGQHATSQARIADIESRAGLSFGPLAALDPFDGEDEGVVTELRDVHQIRFVRV